MTMLWVATCSAMQVTTGSKFRLQNYELFIKNNPQETLRFITAFIDR